MISIDHIELFLGNEKPSLQVRDLYIKSGLWALVGRNGTGKSTFLNALSSVHSRFDGHIRLNGKNQSDISTQQLAKMVSVVFSKTELFGNHSALDVLYLGRIPYQGVFSGITSSDKAKVNEIIELLRLKPLIKKMFSVLSDGEKQLVMIGRALVQDTDIILLDEPTAFLDVVNRKKIISLLAKVAEENSKLIIFSTHNMDLVERFCGGVLMINEDKLIKIDSKLKFKTQLAKLFDHEV
jgi:iron complex transport system ATP-binding protein